MYEVRIIFLGGQGIVFDECDSETQSNKINMNT